MLIHDRSRCGHLRRVCRTPLSRCRAERSGALTSSMVRRSSAGLRNWEVLKVFVDAVEVWAIAGFMSGRCGVPQNLLGGRVVNVFNAARRDVALCLFMR